MEEKTKKEGEKESMNEAYLLYIQRKNITLSLNDMIKVMEFLENLQEYKNLIRYYY